ncbi:hypothetical protein, partial [Barnesiella intestinihominis]|uniref:hypothetical protein n=1 Tax=Barnesiella intestinihominis TaxID=487174 RepID=UPI00399F02FC
GAGRIRATQPNNHKLVGFEIIPVRAMGVTAQIRRVGLQMTGGTGVRDVSEQPNRIIISW